MHYLHYIYHLFTLHSYSVNIYLLIHKNVYVNRHINVYFLAIVPVFSGTHPPDRIKVFLSFSFSAAFNEETHIHLASFLYIFHSFVHILYFSTLKSFILFILTNVLSNIIMEPQITITAVDYFNSLSIFLLSARSAKQNCLHKRFSERRKS